MGVRGRNGEKKAAELAKTKRNEAMKKFTRSDADKALSKGADPSEDRFVKHANYHVRRRSFLLMGKELPTDPEAREKLCKELHLKDPNKVQEDASVSADA